MCGAFELDPNMKVVEALPQEVASGFAAVTGQLIGCKYEPVLYVGKQVVNGTNYCVLAKATPVVQNPEPRLVKVVFNLPAGKIGEGYTIVSVEDVDL